jgi:hypothetical protein
VVRTIAITNTAGEMSGLVDGSLAQVLFDGRSNPFRSTDATLMGGFSDLGGDVGRET